MPKIFRLKSKKNYELIFFFQSFPENGPWDTYSLFLGTPRKVFSLKARIELKYILINFENASCLKVYLHSWERASPRPKVPVFLEVFINFIFLTYSRRKISLCCCASCSKFLALDALKQCLEQLMPMSSFSFDV